jgi:hypothetical protein
MSGGTKKNYGRKNSIRIIDVLAEVRFEYLPNAILEQWSLTCGTRRDLTRYLNWEKKK